MRILLLLALPIGLAGLFVYLRNNVFPALGSPGRTCSFCRKTIDDVRILISAPRVAICDECVDACGDVVVRHAADASRPRKPQAAERTGRVVPFASRSAD
ncbi:MAG: ClpX C4-type zinc finger protein [Candidatus Binatia bacterium]